MDTFEQIKKFLAEGGKCLLIENGKPIGVVLTMEEYEELKNKPETPAYAEASAGRQNQKPEKIELEINNSKNPEPATVNPIGEAMAKEMNFPEASAELSDIALADDIALEDLGLDELPY